MEKTTMRQRHKENEIYKREGDRETLTVCGSGEIIRGNHGLETVDLMLMLLLVLHLEVQQLLQVLQRLRLQQELTHLTTSTVHLVAPGSIHIHDKHKLP